MVAEPIELDTVQELTLGDFGILAKTKFGNIEYIRKAAICSVSLCGDVTVYTNQCGVPLLMPADDKEMQDALQEWLKGMLGVETKTIKVKEDA